MLEGKKHIFTRSNEAPKRSSEAVNFSFRGPYLRICLHGLWRICVHQFPELLTRILYMDAFTLIDMRLLEGWEVFRGPEGCGVKFSSFDATKR